MRDMVCNGLFVVCILQSIVISSALLHSPELNMLIDDLKQWDSMPEDSVTLSVRQNVDRIVQKLQALDLLRNRIRNLLAIRSTENSDSDELMRLRQYYEERMRTLNDQLLRIQYR